jgi:hypothetical protein
MDRLNFLFPAHLRVLLRMFSRMLRMLVYGDVFPSLVPAQGLPGVLQVHFVRIHMATTGSKIVCLSDPKVISYVTLSYVTNAKTGRSSP